MPRRSQRGRGRGGVGGRWRRAGARRRRRAAPRPPRRSARSTRRRLATSTPTSSAGTEVSADLSRDRGAADLSTAVAAGDTPPAALAAVTRIVYHRHWHIVRLRVLDRAGRLLADVGGPLRDRAGRAGRCARAAAVVGQLRDVGPGRHRRRQARVALRRRPGRHLRRRAARRPRYGRRCPPALPRGPTLALGRRHLPRRQRGDLRRSRPARSRSCCWSPPPARARRAAVRGRARRRVRQRRAPARAARRRSARTTTPATPRLSHFYSRRARVRARSARGGSPRAAAPGPASDPAAAAASPTRAARWLVYSFVARGAGARSTCSPPPALGCAPRRLSASARSITAAPSKRPWRRSSSACGASSSG